MARPSASREFISDNDPGWSRLLAQLPNLLLLKSLIREIGSCTFTICPQALREIISSSSRIRKRVESCGEVEALSGVGSRRATAAAATAAALAADVTAALFMSRSYRWLARPGLKLQPKPFVGLSL